MLRTALVRAAKFELADQRGFQCLGVTEDDGRGTLNRLTSNGLYRTARWNGSPYDGLLLEQTSNLSRRRKRTRDGSNSPSLRSASRSRRQIRQGWQKLSGLERLRNSELLPAVLHLEHQNWRVA